MNVDATQLNESISPHLHSIGSFEIKQDNLNLQNKKCSITLKKSFNRLNLIITIDCKKASCTDDGNHHHYPLFALPSFTVHSLSPSLEKI